MEMLNAAGSAIASGNNSPQRYGSVVQNSTGRGQAAAPVGIGRAAKSLL